MEEARDNADLERDWSEDFIHPIRTPIAGWDYLEELLSQSPNARVFLREKAECTDVIVRFPISSRQLPENVLHAYSKLGMDMQDVFSEVIWKKPRRKGSSTLWSELVRTSYKAYREAWMYRQELLYLGHRHPQVKRLFQDFLKTLRKRTARSVGRRGTREEERQSLSRRFSALLKQATDIRKFVEHCVHENLPKAKIRGSVFHQIYGNRIDRHILGTHDSAFAKIPYGKREVPVCLENPSTWKPRQLAIALLACERELQYQTIEKMSTSWGKSHKNSPVSRI